MISIAVSALTQNPSSGKVWFVGTPRESCRKSWGHRKLDLYLNIAVGKIPSGSTVLNCRRKCKQNTIRIVREITKDRIIPQEPRKKKKGTTKYRTVPRGPRKKKERKYERSDRTPRKKERDCEIRRNPEQQERTYERSYCTPRNKERDSERSYITKIVCKPHKRREECENLFRHTPLRMFSQEQESTLNLYNQGKWNNLTTRSTLFHLGEIRASANHPAYDKSVSESPCI